MQTILLTGFEPFGGATVNPSWQAVQQLEGWSAGPHIKIVALCLPCVFQQSLAVLRDAMALYQPVLVIAVGQAGGRQAFSLEKVAINYDDARIPDNAQQQPAGIPVIAGGPAAYFSTLPLKRILTTLRSHGIPTEISYTAGTFVCNHVFYGLMHELAQCTPQHGMTKARGGFIHIPYSPAQACEIAAPSMSIAMTVEALQRTIAVCLEHQDDVQFIAGQLD